MRSLMQDPSHLDKPVRYGEDIVWSKPNALDAVMHTVVGGQKALIPKTPYQGVEV